jgi:oxygen-dependent protoporphyrinogen oxidase
MPEVVIAGAGISGLACAHALARRGRDVLLIDAAPRAGGKIRSERTRGYLVEHGPSGILLREPAMSDLLTDLGLRERAIPTRDAASKKLLCSGGVLRAVPRSPGELLRSPLLSLRGKARLLAELLVPRGGSADETLAGFARRRFGAEAARQIFDPLVSGIFAGDMETLSVAAALPSLARLEREHRSVIAGAARSGSALGGATISFPDGLEELVQALERSLGERVRLGVTLRAIAKTKNGFRLQLEAGGGVEGGGALQTLETEQVVIALPANAAASVFVEWEPGLAAALAAIPYAPLAVVSLGYEDVPRGRLDAFGFLAGRREHVDLLGAVFSSASFDGRAPRGGELVSARLGGALRPDLAALGEDELVARASADLGRLLALGREPTFRHVVKHERALPQYTTGHQDRVAAVEAAERRHAGLHFCGSAYRGAGIPDCVRDGVRVAGRVAANAPAPAAVT